MQSSLKNWFIVKRLYMVVILTTSHGYELWHWWLSSLSLIFVFFVWIYYFLFIHVSLLHLPDPWNKLTTLNPPKGTGITTSGNFHYTTCLSWSQEWQTFRQTADGTSTNTDVDESICFLGYHAITMAEILWYIRYIYIYLDIYIYIESRQTIATSPDLTFNVV